MPIKQKEATYIFKNTFHFFWNALTISVMQCKNGNTQSQVFPALSCMPLLLTRVVMTQSMIQTFFDFVWPRSHEACDVRLLLWWHRGRENELEVASAVLHCQSILAKAELWPPNQFLMGFVSHKQTHSWGPNKLQYVSRLFLSPFLSCMCLFFLSTSH